jgi:DNA-binding transcriptional ArsR family regulator
LINGSVEYVTATMTRPSAGASDDELSATFGALADPTRRALLARLAEGEATVNELAEPFAISLQAISKHLQVLERAGLITRGREAQWRPCRLETAPLAGAQHWIERNTQVWNDRLDRLGQHLQNLQRQSNPTLPSKTTEKEDPK